MVITIESYVIEKRDGNVSFNDRDFRRIPLYSVLFHFIRKNRTFNFFEIRKIELALKLKSQNHMGHLKRIQSYFEFLKVRENFRRISTNDSFQAL